MMEAALKKLCLADADAVALVFRLAFDARLPSLAGLHTPAEDRRFFRERVFPAADVWGAFERTTLVGFIAFREHWIDHLYVLPAAQGRGVGSALLEVARSVWPDLQLWTFQRNHGARHFYERHGFVVVSETDGADNAEQEPDVLYRWTT